MPGITTNIGKRVTKQNSDSLSSYWSTLISATVEDANPDKVVLTFSASNTAVASDFTIDGFTISSGYWCGSVLTLILSTEVLYGESLVINHVPTSKTQNITNNTISYHYVDSFSGNDANDGTIAHPYKTLTYADTQLAANAPLKLKYPDGTWHRSPAIWHTLRAFFPMVAGADTTKVYDVANGLVGTISGAVKYSGTKYPGISLESNGYVDLGAGALGIGTGDQTILASVFPASNGTGPFVIFSNGAIGAQKGWALGYSSDKAYYQMRSTTTSLNIIGGTTVTKSTLPNDSRVIVSTNKRNNAAGMKLYMDGVSDASAVDNTPLSTTDLTNSTAKTLIGARDASGVGFYLGALWIKELRIYSSELAESDVIAATIEARATINTDYAFGSGSYISMGIDSDFYTSTHLHLGISGNYNTPFFPITQATYTGNPSAQFGNASIIALNTNKCNGTIPACAGEINWLMCHVSSTTDSLHPPDIAKSHNGIDWSFIMRHPGIGPDEHLGCSWFVDNDDPTDISNIHLILCDVYTGDIYESHPLNSEYTQWSDVVLIFNTGIIQSFQPSIIKIGSTYHCFFSTFSGGNHYWIHATGTTGVFTETNDWEVVQTGDWSGLGHLEVTSFFFVGGTTWRMIYLDITAMKWKYTTSTDNCATWSAGTIINSLSTPLQYAVGAIKLK